MKKKPKTLIQEFDDYLELKSIDLYPWQKYAAYSFLAIVQAFDKPASGKSFLLHVLTDFFKGLWR